MILWIMHYIPGCRMRCDEETEILGVDDAEMGEFAYDYVGIDAEGEDAVAARQGEVRLLLLFFPILPLFELRLEVQTGVGEASPLP